MPRVAPGGLSPSEEAAWYDGYDTGYADGNASGTNLGKTDAYDKALDLAEALTKDLANLGLEGPANKARRLWEKIKNLKDTETTP